MKALVKRHEGQITATSAGLGAGSEFTVLLPLVTARAGPVELFYAGPRTVTRRRICLVEDNPDCASCPRAGIGS